MINLFITILNMSLTGAFVIGAICLTRLILRKSPKILLYCLWIVAGFRLVFPFSIESSFSLMPFGTQVIPVDIAMDSTWYTNDFSVVALLDGGSSSQMWMTIGLMVWLAGVFFMLIRGVNSLAILKGKLKEATNVEANVYQVETLKTPLVIGVFSPKIYLPAHLSAKERKLIVLHEQAHIRRRDHVVKFVAYFILCLHWFNPLVWLAFSLMNMDMEMSCDERVLKELGIGGEVKKSYSSALLSLATEQPIVPRSTLAFIDGDVRPRVKNILNLKKQSFVVFVMSMLLVVVLSVGFSVNRVNTYATNYDVNQEANQADFFHTHPCCE